MAEGQYKPVAAEEQKHSAHAKDEEEKKRMRREDSKGGVNRVPCEVCGAMVVFENYVKHMEAHKPKEATPSEVKEYPSSAQELPRVVYTGKGADQTCRICLLNYEPKQILTYLPCVHSFHDECITPWLQQHSECPICKKNVFGAPKRESNSSSEIGRTIGNVAVSILVGALFAIGKGLLKDFMKR
jgi:hypothetical protein